MGGQISSRTHIKWGSKAPLEQYVCYLNWLRILDSTLD
jgi:hypothetical protein